MTPDDLTDDQLDDLATKLAPRLPTGTHGDRVILPRRAFMGAVGGAVGVGALTALGVDEAAAQAAGSQGTESEPNNMYAWDLDVQNGATFNGTDIEDVGSVSAEQLLINDVILSSGEYINTTTIWANEDIPDFSSTSYESLGDTVGAVAAGDVPPGATLYGRILGRFGNNSTGETATMTVRIQTNSGNATDLTEIELTSDSLQSISGEWTEITSQTDDVFWGTSSAIRAKVSGGTGRVSGNQIGAQFAWRID